MRFFTLKFCKEIIQVANMAVIRLFLAFLFAQHYVSVVKATETCEACVCQDNEDSFLVNCSDSAFKLDLNFVSWPNNKSVIKGTFEHLSLFVLPK